MSRNIVDVNKLLEEYEEIGPEVRNGHLMALFIRSKNCKVQATKLFASHFPGCNKAAVKTHLGNVVKEVKRLKKSIRYERSWRELCELLKKPYIFLKDKSTTRVTSGDTGAVSNAALKLRNWKDCVSCSDKRKQIRNIQQKNSSLKQLIHRARHIALSNKRLKQKAKRNDCEIKKLRSLVRKLIRKQKKAQQVPEVISDLKLVNNKLRRAIDRRNKKIGELEGRVVVLEGDASVQEKSLQEYAIANDYLLSTCDDDEDDRLEEDVGIQRGKFSTNVRKVVYKSLLSQVPVAHTKGLISYVLQELAGIREFNVPHKSTVARMAYELSALSFIQAAETLIDSDCSTLCWDATTLGAQHINEVHISTETSTFTVSIAKLPGGRTSDYTAHISSTIDELASTYALYSGQSFINVKNKIVSKISSTISDRAPVNHCVVERIKEELELNLIELNCNLHPLDGFASHARTALSKIDKDDGIVNSGRDCGAANFIYALSKLRYKQTGDPAGFKAFMSKNDIPSGAFVRYVGNRLHVLFHTAGSIITYKLKLLEYLERYCRLESRTKLLSDLQDQRLLAQFQGLGLCGKIITGPWMVLFYTNKEGLSNLGMIPKIQSCKENLQKFSSNPLEMLTTSTDVFGNNLDSTRVLDALRETDDTHLLAKYLSVILAAFYKVFEKQLGPYLNGPLSHASQETLELTKSASPNNIWAERSLGMTDALWRRAPNASVGFIDAKVKAKTNNTLGWLDSKDIATQEKLVKFAVVRGSQLRKGVVRQSTAVDEVVSQRLQDLGQARDKRKRKALEKEVKDALKRKDHEDQVFHAISHSQQDFLIKIVNGGDVMGAIFRHTWESDEGRNVTYLGRIRDVTPPTKTKSTKLTIGYWEDGTAESTSEDYDLDVHSLLADMITGDLLFI